MQHKETVLNKRVAAPVKDGKYVLVTASFTVISGPFWELTKCRLQEGDQGLHVFHLWCTVLLPMTSNFQSVYELKRWKTTLSRDDEQTQLVMPGGKQVLLLIRWDKNQRSYDWRTPVSYPKWCVRVFLTQVMFICLHAASCEIKSSSDCNGRVKLDWSAVEMLPSRSLGV